MRSEDDKPRGIYSAVPTPFQASGDLDLERLLDLMAWQLDPCGDSVDRGERGVQGFVIYGTTGESPTLTLAEREQITRAAVARFPTVEMIAGVGSNSTTGSVELATQARAWGASGGLVVTPYYNKPSQEGLYRHFATIAEATPEWPLILYVVPGRASVSLDVEVVEKLLRNYPHIVGVKDATADLAYAAELLSCCGERAHVLSGDDPTALAAWSLGMQGSISVVSNLIPSTFATLWAHHTRGERDAARRLFLAIHPLIRALFVESNPIPLKEALGRWSAEELIPITGLTSHVRPPLAPLNEAQRLVLCAALESTREVM